MNEVPPSQDDSGVDEHYRRAAALDASRPSEAVRRRVLEHAAALTAKRANEQRSAPAAPTPQGTGRRLVARRARWRPAIFGTLAAAGIAGLLVVPRFFNPQPAEGPVTAALRRAPSADNPAASVTVQIPTGAPSGPAAAASEMPALAMAPTQAEPPRPQPPAMAKAATHNAAAAHLEAVPPPQATADMPAPQAYSAAAPDFSAAARGGPAAALSGSTAVRADPGAALRRAAESGDVDGLQALLDGGADINARDASGRTALMLATLTDQTGSVAALLNRGADPNAADASGTTPLQAALSAHRPVIATALRRAGAH